MAVLARQAAIEDAKNTINRKLDELQKQKDQLEEQLALQNLCGDIKSVIGFKGSKMPLSQIKDILDCKEIDLTAGNIKIDAIKAQMDSFLYVQGILSEREFSKPSVSVEFAGQ